MLNKLISAFTPKQQTADQVIEAIHNTQGLNNNSGTVQTKLALNALNSLLGLKLTGIHSLDIGGLPVVLNFDDNSNLVSITAKSDVKKQRSYSNRVQIKRNLPH